MAKKKELTVAEKLKHLYELQLVDSQLDEVEILKGELPMEVRDLEDELRPMAIYSLINYFNIKDTLNSISNNRIVLIAIYIYIIDTFFHAQGGCHKTRNFGPTKIRDR